MKLVAQHPQYRKAVVVRYAKILIDWNYSGVPCWLWLSIPSQIQQRREAQEEITGTTESGPKTDPGIFCVRRPSHDMVNGRVGRHRLQQNP